MGNERQGSKGGGFLQLFDWNGKSRKKLFSSKSDLPEQSKQKKRCDGNLPMTRFQLVDEEDAAGAVSIRGSDYSCASSVTDEDFCGTKAPGVVARLMGLDSLPKPNITDPCSTPLFDSQSLRDAFYRPKSFENRQYPQTADSISLHELSDRIDTERKPQKVIQKPFDKFQTEILPPKSAKTIPITHHKLLSPIKSTTFIPPKDAAHIMEAAARIIEREPQAETRIKLSVGSSSVPLKLKDLKDKVQKPLKLHESSNMPSESGSTVKNLMRHSMNKSCNGLGDSTSLRILSDREESSVGANNKGKSISLALQAKVNVQKREGLNLNSSKTFVMQKEASEFSPNQMFKSQPNTQKIMIKKPSTQNSSNVLRPNIQKQNCTVDRGKLQLKSSENNPSAAKQRHSGKLSTSSKVSSRKMGTEFKAEKREVISSGSERVACKKRSIDGNFQSEKNQVGRSMRVGKNDKATQSSATMDKSNGWDQDSGTMGTDVVSFTFTAPMTRTGHCSARPMEVGENYKTVSDFQSKMTLHGSDGMSSLKFSFMDHSVKGSDSLSSLLEQKLKELTEKLDFSQQKSRIALDDMKPGLEGNKVEYGMDTDNRGVLKEKGVQDINMSHAIKLPNCRHPSPISVLEHCSTVDSCISTDTGDSYSTEGSKHYSSTQAQEIFGMYHLKTSIPNERNLELSDSASSTSAITMAKGHEVASSSTSSQKRGTWELKYVKDILCSVNFMFEDYSLGRISEIINPHLFNQMEIRKAYSDFIPGMNRRLLFDCVRECMDLRCRQYVGGGCKLWVKGLSVVGKKERLAEEVYKEISGWDAMGDSMVDEIVYKDMSSQCGRWLDFEIEAFELGLQIESRVLDALIDEVISDILVL